MNVTLAFISMVIATIHLSAFIVVITGLVVAAILFAISLLLLRSKGMNRKQMFILIGGVIGAMLLVPLLVRLGVPVSSIAVLAPIMAVASRSRGRCGRNGQSQSRELR